MERLRFVYKVTIEQDQVPGWNHEPDDFERFLKRFLDQCVGHYDPTVEFIDHTDESQV